MLTHPTDGHRAAPGTIPESAIAVTRHASRRANFEPVLYSSGSATVSARVTCVKAFERQMRSIESHTAETSAGGALKTGGASFVV